MALTQKSWPASTSGDAWTDIVVGPANVASLTCSTKSVGMSSVAMRVMRGAVAYSVVSPKEIDEGDDQRFRIPPMVLQTGDKMQVKSLGLIDWWANGTTS